MSRAQWLAYGSTLAVVGCTTGGARTPSTSPEVLIDSTTSAVADAIAPEALDATSRVASDASDGAASEWHDATVVDVVPPGAWLTSGEGGFLCVAAGSCQFGPPCFDADVICDRSAEWCWANGGGYAARDGCRSWNTTCGSADPITDACPGSFHWNANACDGGLRRCACLTVTCGSGFCSDDDAGGLSVSCGHCYGAPPARLERLERAAPVG